MKKPDGKEIVIEYGDIDVIKFVLRVLYEHENDELAWRLVERFGGVPELFRASFYELMQVSGVTERVASFFSVMLPVQRQALLRAAQGIKLDCESVLIKYVAAFCIGFIEPFDMCMLLDKDDKLIRAERLIEEERFREMVTHVCSSCAAKVVIARFVPFEAEEPLIPSAVRVRSLVKLIDIFYEMNVELVDYFAYTPFKFFGLRRTIGGGEPVLHVNEADDNIYMIDGNLLSRVNDYCASLTGERVELF